jgi:hypothetical protein
VINPFSRYRLAVRARDGANPPEWPEIHHRATTSLALRGQHGGGQPDAALERGEKVLTPPAIWFPGARRRHAQTTRTSSRISRQRAAALRRQLPQGRRRDSLEYLEMERHAGHSPDLSQVGDMFERMAAFVGRHVKVYASVGWAEPAKPTIGAQS